MDKLLEYKRVSFTHLMVADRGSGAKMDLSTWRPELPEGWYYLGQAASANWTTSPNSVIVKALQPDVLKDVAGWELVWKSEGSRKPLTCALWRGIPPSDEYAVVGGIFSTNPGWAPPTQDQTSGIKAVRKDALKKIDGSTKTGAVTQVWIDKGTDATRHGSVWTVMPHSDYPSEVLYPFSMIPAGDDSDWKQPSAESCYILAAKKTVNTTNDAFLAWQYVSFTRLMAAKVDPEGLATKTYWLPDLPDGWYCFGNIPSSSESYGPRSVIVLELQPDILQAPVSWGVAWADKGSDPPHTQWYGIPRSNNYRVQFWIDTFRSTQSPPTEDEKLGVVAVRKDVMSNLLDTVPSNLVGSGYIFPRDKA